jgi:hypothetical protein
MKPPLLPSDKYLARQLGLTDEQYRWFRAEVQSKVRIDPSQPTAGPLAVALVTTLISVGLQIIASFLKPRPPNPGNGGLRQQSVDGLSITNNQRFAPRRGFDSFQEPAALGTTIPVIYANRRNLVALTDPPRPEGRYGGIRINMPLIWSQLQSTGGSQFLRSIFMVGEGRIGCIDPSGFALGNSTLTGYSLSTNAVTQSSGRLTIYWAENGGRITSDNYLLGREAAGDLGNAQNAGGADVYEVRSAGGAFRPDFSYTSKPSTDTQFGLYGICANNLGLRLSPRLRPTVQLSPESRNNGTAFFTKLNDDRQALVDIWKAKYWWSGRSGISSTSTGGSTLVAGDTFSYSLNSQSDRNTRIWFNALNSIGPIGAADAFGQCGDIASTVSSRQQAAANSLSIGELYKVGSCLAVLTAMTPDDQVFASTADGGAGVNVDYTFTVVRAGTLTQAPLSHIVPPTTGATIAPPFWFYALFPIWKLPFEQIDNGQNYEVGTSAAHIFRCALAHVTLNRAAKVFELGIRSTVGIRVSGICNFKDSQTMNEIDLAAGNAYAGGTFPSETSIVLNQFTSGQMTSPQERYSFFRVATRKRDEAFTDLACSIGVRSASSEAIYNYLRLEMPTSDVWDIRLEPISGWEIREGYAAEPMIVLDPDISGSNSLTIGSVVVSWTGTIVARSASTFRLEQIEPTRELGINKSDGTSQVDEWGKVAEAFVYEEIQTTAQQGPEHEIVYVNLTAENETVPQYDNLAIVGLNIRVATEWQQFGQFSCYITGGRTVKRLLFEDAWGPSSLFPDILRDLLRNPRFGAGQAISDLQIDTKSFREAAQFCQDRRYFFDGALTEKQNLRQWAADVAATMLLDLTQKSGKFALAPAIYFAADGPVPISALFTAGNIIEDSFSLEFVPEEDRQPMQASVKWREERARELYSGGGLFPVEREVLIREADRPDTDPIESFDLSDYCTSLEHAIDFGCYVIRLKRLVTHTIKFQTTPDALVASIAPGEYIRVAMDYTFYDEFANGIVLDDGTIVTSREDLLGDGTHDVTSWDGSAEATSDVTLTVTGGLGSPTGIIFVKKSTTSQVRTYKIETISIAEDGAIEVEAVHHPVTETGHAAITANWTTYETDVNWVIQRG